MKTLLLMRHAKARADVVDLDDHQRPLSTRGERAAPAMGRELVRLGLVPELVISSTAVRAVSTARAVVMVTERTIELRATSALYLAPPSTYRKVIARVPAAITRLLVVGHNPGLEELTSDLSGHPEAMPTGAIAGFELALDDWAGLETCSAARLLTVLRPRLVDG